MAQQLHADGQRAAGGIAADQRDAMRVGKIEQSRRESLQPRRSALGRVSASVAHAGVAPIAAKSLKLTASARWPIERASVPIREMPPRDDGIHGRHQFACPAAREQCRIVADPENDAASCSTRRLATHKKAAYQVELAEIGVSARTHRESIAAGLPYSCGRNSRAARSSTALTNLCPSVAPNCLVNCTASAKATRYGNRDRTPARAVPATAPRVRPDRVRPAESR
jgi:hypothetical protein